MNRVMSKMAMVAGRTMANSELADGHAKGDRQNNATQSDHH
jgi:hypothetical protein